MKAGVCIVVFMLCLVPVQATLLYSVSPWGLRPDVYLIAACLVGLWGGWVRGVLVGVALGVIQDLFSASPLWLNLLTKAGAGFLAGTLARNLSNMASPLAFFPVAALSFVWGIVWLLSSRAGAGEMLYSAVTLLVPQAVVDGVVAIGLNWIIARWVVTTQVREDWAVGLRGGRYR